VSTDVSDNTRSSSITGTLENVPTVTAPDVLNIENKSDPPQSSVMSAWAQKQWVWVARMLGLTGIALVVFVAGTLIWITNEVTHLGARDLAFSFSGMALLSLTLLRFLAILIGAGMVFGGLALSFFSHAKVSTVGMNSPAGATPISMNLATASPGLAAVVVGAVVIISALYAKGEHKYEGQPLVITPSESAAPADKPMKAPDELGK
jgi:hypothetical protein